MTTQIRMGQDPELGLPPGWNDTATAYERHSTIHDVFAERVAERPNAPAVEEGQRSLTYQELDGLSSPSSRPTLPPGCMPSPPPMPGAAADRVRVDDRPAPPRPAYPGVWTDVGTHTLG